MTRYINAGRLLLKKNLKKKKIMTQTNMISKFKPCTKQLTVLSPQTDNCLLSLHVD